MAREFKLLSVLWLVAACFAISGDAATDWLRAPSGQDTTNIAMTTTAAPNTKSTPSGQNTTSIAMTTTAAPNTKSTPSGQNTTSIAMTTTAAPNTKSTPSGQNTTSIAMTTTAAPNTKSTPSGQNTTSIAASTTTAAPATKSTPSGQNTTSIAASTTTAAPNTKSTPSGQNTTSIAMTTTAAPNTKSTPSGQNTTSIAMTTTAAPNTKSTPSGQNTTSIAMTTTAAPNTKSTPSGQNTTSIAMTTTAAPNTKSTPSGQNTTSIAMTTTAAPNTKSTPSGQNTTSIAASTTTAAPATKSTPSGQNTTSIAASTTTAAPATTSAPSGQNTTSIAASTATAGPSTTTAAATTTTTVLPTTKPDPCAVNPCGDGSTCEPRANQTFACLCLAGDFYNEESKRCEIVKVFPGQLVLPNLTYNKNMTDKTSPTFQKASQTIIVQLSDVFETHSGYTGSTVLELQPIKRSKAWSRSENGVDASVEIIFKPNANITSEAVKKMFENATACSDCPLEGVTFNEGKLCDKNACDVKTTNCESKDGSFKCSCKEDYIKTDFSSRICVACPSGQKAEGSICVNCQFGYSGLNCSESWQLVLVIVGSVLGGLLLITLILLPVVASMCSKKSSKKNKNADIGKSYVSNSPAKAPLVNRGYDNNQAASLNGSAYASAGVPRIPRATTTSWDSKTNLEMTPSNSRQNLVPAGRNSRLYEETDDVNPYAQARTQSSLYGQNRPQINPYASSQGHTNPYYMHGNGRQFD
ncbi:mucin-13-like [Micropterus dolomieu]|uniref:mucin-13-like n=1 Tax=Micropterus dolomieu TaxID=147949 RepID=UPI001E8E81B1|nr:mucin-13-like [Micropterus dolomieu]